MLVILINIILFYKASIKMCKKITHTNSNLGGFMIFIKDTCLITIIIICSYIGFLKSKTFENRVLELSKFQNALVMFESKLKFTYEPIKNIFEEISNVIYKNENNVFFYTSKEKRNIYKAWCTGIDENKYFNEEDRNVTKMMGKLLGKTDIEGQLSEIELGLELINKQIKDAEIEKNKNSKLYKTMGVILGIGISIILI